MKRAVYLAAFLSFNCGPKNPHDIPVRLTIENLTVQGYSHGLLVAAQDIPVLTFGDKIDSRASVLISPKIPVCPQKYQFCSQQDGYIILNDKKKNYSLLFISSVTESISCTGECYIFLPSARLLNFVLSHISRFAGIYVLGSPAVGSHYPVSICDTTTLQELPGGAKGVFFFSNRDGFTG